jgi:hypothetical protein
MIKAISQIIQINLHTNSVQLTDQPFGEMSMDVFELVLTKSFLLPTTGKEIFICLLAQLLKMSQRVLQRNCLADDYHQVFIPSDMVTVSLLCF